MQMTSTFKSITIGFIIAATALAASAFGIANVQAVASLDSIESGDLIRGESLSAVYYMGEDGLRYVFPNKNTYDTWYDNFDTVKTISDADLTTIQIGGNVTYRPGVRMIKIVSAPDTYAVSHGGVLRHIGSEEIAEALYGSDWNQQIDDLADGFFTNYQIGSEITDASSYDKEGLMEAASSINEELGLEAPTEFEITDSGYTVTELTIEVGGSVKFINNGSENHSAMAEDLSWGTGTIMPGGAYIQTFEEAGTYPFFDSYDSANTGAIYVE